MKQANLLRYFAAEMVQKAGSGHLGMPLGMSDVCAVLWHDFMNWSNSNPNWPNRDRFILSCGHGSALLYAQLYSMGLLKDCTGFRKLNSGLPGHPELGPGVELTTGPLGQGLAWGIGIAYSAQLYPELDHYTYIFCSDGDLMEGIAHEALAIGRLLNLRRCIVFWDDNRITIDGSTDISTKEPIANIFTAHGWEIIEVDGHDHEKIRAGIIQARGYGGPVCIRCRTTIGKYLPQANTSAAHGSPKFDLAQLKRDLNLSDTDIANYADFWQESRIRGDSLAEEWHANHPDFQFRSAQEPDWSTILSKSQNEMTETMASRQIIPLILNQLDGIVGSADLGESTCTMGHPQYHHFGVREHGMIAALGGMCVHGTPAFGATFLAFTDYARPAIRLASLMRTPIKIIATHDSIGVGEDGPTHQPVEHLNSYRVMPNIHVWRPCNLEEMVAAFIDTNPTIISCSRQKFRVIPSNLDMAKMGGYVIIPAADPQITLIATGSEVSLAADVAMLLKDTQVVSMPCIEAFEAMGDRSILKGFCVSIEASSTHLWHKYADLCIGIDGFGLSGDYMSVMREYGFTAEAIAKKILHDLIV